MALWTPAELGDTPVLWLDASNHSSITFVSGLVQQWNDQSGNERHAWATSSNSRPSYDANGISTGRASIYFGSSRILRAPSWSTQRNFTIFSVARPAGTSNRRYLMVLGQPIAFRNDNQRVGYYADGAWRGTATALTSAQIIGWRLHRYNGGITYRNGAVLESGLVYNNGFGSETGTGYCEVGGRTWNSGWSLAHIGEVIVCSAALDASDIARIEGYLAHKWGLAGLLPGAHEYKAAPPVASVVAGGHIQFSATASTTILTTNASATGSVQVGASAKAAADLTAPAASPIVLSAEFVASRLRSVRGAGAILVDATADAVIGNTPVQVSGITFQPASDSLVFAWQASTGADGYRARLYRDGALVESQDVGDTLEATFLGLEDGTIYVAEIQGYNEVGYGKAGVREAQTLYLVPDPPSNLRQEGETFVLIRAQWDAPASKVTFYHSQLIIEDPFWKVYDETLSATPLERLYPAPLAGTQYKWRLRAATPAGYSTWVETDVTTAWLQPDSRLAALPAAYQEDFLFPDTWPAGTNAGEAQPEPVHAGLEFFAGYLRADRYSDRAALGFSIQTNQWFKGPALIEHDDSAQNHNRAALGFSITSGGLFVGTAMQDVRTDDYEPDQNRAALDFVITGFLDVGLVLFTYTSPEERALVDFSISGSLTVGAP